MKKQLALLGAALTLVTSFATAHAQDYTFRLHQFLPATNTVPANGIEPWAKRIEEASNGRIKIELYPSMQLGGTPPQLFDQTRDGVVDFSWTVLGYTPGRFPKTEVFETPFMVASAEATSRALQRYVEEYAMDEFADVHLIAVHTHGAGLFHTKTPIEKLEDLKDRKIRGGSRVVNEMLESLGAEPIGMPVPAVPESLSKGVIEGAALPWEVTAALKTGELVRNHTEFSGDNGLYTLTFALTMNKQSYDSLPDDLKAIIDAESGVELAGKFGRAMDEGDVKVRQETVDMGNTIIVLDEAETARWKQAAQPAIDNWIAARPDGQMLYDAAVKLVQDETAKLAN